MKTNLTKKMPFFILGCARSGTTIVANLFNGLEDGFCLGEPHWMFEMEGGIGDAYGKLEDQCPPINALEDIMPSILQGLKNGPYHTGGYKETIHPKNLEFFQELVAAHLPLVEFFVIVLRSPAMLLESAQAFGEFIYLRPWHINEIYEWLDELANSSPRSVVVILEDYVRQPLDYLNLRLPFKIKGPVVLECTGRYGCSFAQASERILPEIPYQRGCNSPGAWPKELGPAKRIWREWRG